MIIHDLAVMMGYAFNLLTQKGLIFELRKEASFREQHMQDNVQNEIFPLNTYIRLIDDLKSLRVNMQKLPLLLLVNI